MLVGRERELKRLEIVRKLVEGDLGVFVIIEGPAGIGKTELVNEFSKSLQNFEVRRSRADPELQFTPFSLFTRAFEENRLEDIPRGYQVRTALELARELERKRGVMMLVDESSGFYTCKIAKELNNVQCIASKHRGDFIITEIDGENSVKPYEAESQLLDIMANHLIKGGAVVIENLNYLIHILGLEKVLLFLRDAKNIINEGLLIVWADLSALEGEESDKLKALFDEVHRFEFHGEDGNTMVFTHSIPQNLVLFSEKGDEGYLVSESSDLRPTMLNFHLLEKVIEELKRNDIALKCMRTLIDYNSPREVYIWLKYVRDVAMMRGHRVYVDISELTDAEIAKLRSLADLIEVPQYRETSVYRIYDNFLSFLGSAAKRNKLALIFEDVQWADRNSLELLDYLARNVPSGVLVLITYRGEDVALSNHAEVIQSMFEYPTTEIIRLGPLRKEDALSLIKQLGMENAEAIYEKSGGHPLLIVEMSKFRGKHFVPESVRESVAYRLNRLDDRTLYILRFMSVAGMEIEKSIVRDVLNMNFKISEELEDILSEKGKVIRFKNAMVRDYLYRTMTPDMKVQFHEMLGEYYAEKSVFKAAYHLYKSRSSRAIEFLKLAAEKSEEQYALETAIDFYSMAAEIAERQEREDILDILKRLANLESMTGRYESAKEHYRRILEMEKSGDVLLKMASTLIDLGRYDEAEQYLNEAINEENEHVSQKAKHIFGLLHLQRGELEEAERYYEDYKNYVAKHGTKSELAEAYMSLSALRFYQSRYKEALKFAREAMNISRGAVDYKTLSSMYNLLGVIYDVLGRSDEALEKFQRLYELAKRAGDLKYMAYAYNNIGVLYYSMGDLQKVRKYLESALKLHKKMGNRKFIATSYYNLAGLYADIGDYQRAFAYFKKAVEIYKKIGDMHSVALAEIWYGLSLIEAERVKEAKEHIVSGLKVAEDMGYSKAMLLGNVGLARISMHDEDYKRAEEIMKNSGELADIMKEDMDVYPLYLITLCELSFIIGNAKEGEVCIGELSVVSEKSEDFEIGGYLHLFRAMMNVHSGEDGESEFKECLSILEKGGYVSPVAHAYLTYGMFLRSRGKEFKKYLRGARDIYERMNLTNVVEKIDSLCGEC